MKSGQLIEYNMHPVSTNQIADIFHFNYNGDYR